MSDKTRSKQSMQKTKLIQSGTSSPNKRIIQNKMTKKNEAMQKTKKRIQKENFKNNRENYCLTATTTKTVIIV